jgi:DNA-directed RNA polymerase specialized sigma24 family protein
MAKNKQEDFKKFTYPRVSDEDKINIKGMLEGSEADFIEIYNRYEQPIRAYLHSLYYPNTIECEADTLHTDTFIKFRKALPKFKGKESVKSRLRRIAYGLYADCMRKIGEIPIYIDPGIEIGQSGNVLPSATERILCMQNCLDQSLRLSGKKNKCIKGLILHAIGTTAIDIAEILAIATAKAATTFLNSCRKKLIKRDQLEDCLENCASKVQYKESHSHVK